MPLLLLCMDLSIIFSSSGSMSCSEMALTGRKGESVKNVAEETRDIGQKIKRISIADQHVDGYSYPRSTIIKHTVLQQETLKHVIKQSCWSASVQGTHFQCELVQGLPLINFLYNNSFL